MKRIRKPRRLWLNLKIKPKGLSRERVIRRLIRAIEEGDYEYPKRWKIMIGWKNSQFAELKWGEFTREMTDSRNSPHWGSTGFDSAVLDYLRGKLDE